MKVSTQIKDNEFQGRLAQLSHQPKNTRPSLYGEVGFLGSIVVELVMVSYSLSLNPVPNKNGPTCIRGLKVPLPGVLLY